MERKKLLIMYATYGTGHKSIANYIADYFSKRNYDIILLDVLDLKTKFLGNFTQKFYNKIMFTAPRVWDFLYKISNFKIPAKITGKFDNKLFNSKKLKELVLEFNPDVVIATHFLGASYVSKLKYMGLINSKLICIVTDYRGHMSFYESYKYADAIIISSKEEKRDLLKKGWDGAKIKTYGIPISTEMAKKEYNKHDLLKKFKVTGTRPIILFYGGGGNGSTASVPYLLELIDLKLDADIFFVCGKNEKLRKYAIHAVKKHDAKNIRVLGFITNGPEYMRIADFVITKPGGITVTECLCFNRPMVLIKSAGGQEGENVKYLVKNKYAINARWLFIFRHTVKKLVDDDKYLENFKKNVSKINKTGAMDKLYELTEKLVNKN